MRLLRRHDAQRQQRRHDIKTDDRRIGGAHAERGEQPGAGERAGNARGVHGGAGDADCADQEIVRHDGRHQRAAHAKVRGPDQAHQHRNDENVRRPQGASQHQCQQRRRQHRVDGAHHRKQVAVADTIAHHPEHRRNQRADIAERGEQGEQQHRAGLDQHVPAEDQRLHLERPGGEQICGPLEAVIPDAERGERGRPRDLAQSSMPRIIAFHPARFLVGRERLVPGGEIIV